MTQISFKGHNNGIITRPNGTPIALPQKIVNKYLHLGGFIRVVGVPKVGNMAQVLDGFLISFLVYFIERTKEKV